MSKLIVASDVHGFYSAWQQITAVLKKEDTLAIAGDFFDTKYGHRSNDYHPELILNEFLNLPNTTWYVYGNCDETSFCPGYDYKVSFQYNGLNILLTHGNLDLEQITDFDILITGHTHRTQIKRKGNRIYLNPGSIALPKDGLPTYAIIENNLIEIIGVNVGGIKKMRI